MQQSLGLQRAGHNWATELNWIEWDCKVQEDRGQIFSFVFFFPFSHFTLAPDPGSWLTLGKLLVKLLNKWHNFAYKCYFFHLCVSFSNILIYSYTAYSYILYTVYFFFIKRFIANTSGFFVGIIPFHFMILKYYIGFYTWIYEILWYTQVASSWSFTF